MTGRARFGDFLNAGHRSLDSRAGELSPARGDVDEVSRSLRPRSALGQPERGSANDIRAAVAGLSQLLACRLACTAMAAAGADQAACHDAARYARKVHDLLAGEDP